MIQKERSRVAKLQKFFNRSKDESTERKLLSKLQETKRDLAHKRFMNKQKQTEIIAMKDYLNRIKNMNESHAMLV